MLKLQDNYICALDIGSSKVVACAARLKKGRVSNIFFENLPARGVKGGVIVDSIELVNSITTLIRSLKAKSELKIKSVNVSISGLEIVTKHSRAIIPLTERGNKVITALDIERVNEQARILGSCLEEETVHIIPSGYSIDSKTGITSPLGLYSHKLETDLFLVCAKLSAVQSLSRVVNQSGLDIKNLFFSGFATSKAVFNKELSKGVHVFCDIGSDSTQLLLFKDGVLCDVEVLALGGDDLTRELQEDLKIPFELAEDIKKSHGSIGDSSHIRDDKEILVKKTHLYKPIKQKLVAQLITNKAKFICEQIKQAVEKKSSCYDLDSFVVCGRTVLSEGFIETLEHVLSAPVKLARIHSAYLETLVKDCPELSGQKYLTYLTVLGMLSLELEEKAVVSPTNPHSRKNPFLRAVYKFKDVYQEYF